MKKWQAYPAVFFALNVFIGIAEASVGGTSRTWPWDAFLKSLAQEFTGPLPTTLGILGIVGAAFSLLSGHAGDGTKKFIVIILVVSIALTAPTLMSWMTSDSGGSATGILLGGI
ncbi:MAG: TrbC/VirB2 family protein [Negativicutes bacterium]|nr:TrbC/VirB2 family protein [Negativicutes bacterium]